jgi:hypothetical protein
MICEEAKRIYDGLLKILQWENHLVSIGQGHRTEMDPKQALEIARKAHPKLTPELIPPIRSG